MLGETLDVTLLHRCFLYYINFHQEAVRTHVCALSGAALPFFCYKNITTEQELVSCLNYFIVQFECEDPSMEQYSLFNILAWISALWRRLLTWSSGGCMLWKDGEDYWEEQATNGEKEESRVKATALCSARLIATYAWHRKVSGIRPWQLGQGVWGMGRALCFSWKMKDWFQAHLPEDPQQIILYRASPLVFYHLG